MNKIVIEVEENGEISVYSDTKIDLEIVDWRDVKNEVDEIQNGDTHLFGRTREEHAKEVMDNTERHLFHITTGMEAQ